MDLLRQEELREAFLVTLWEMHAGDYAGDRNTKELCSKLGLDFDTNCSTIALPLHQDGLVSWGAGFAWISLTPKGRQEAERIVKSRYAEKEKRVLRKVYDLSGPDHSENVDGVLLVQELGISNEEVSLILRDLDKRKGLLRWDVGDYIQMTGAGIELIESGEQKPRTRGDTYHTTIGTVQGGAHIGPGGTQNIHTNITNNPDFDIAISSLLQLVQASSLKAPDKEELTDDIVKVNNLALREPSDGMVDKINRRFEFVKAGLQAGNLIIAASPHLDAIWHYFKIKYNL